MKKIIIVFIGFALSSCSYQLWFKPKYITFQYNGQYTGLDSSIEINGYYVSEIITPENTKLFKPYVELFLLYKDGTIISTSSQPGREACENRINKILFEEKKHNAWEYQWGLYQLKEDTIVSQLIRDDGPMSLPVVFEKRFLIMSNTILKIIYEKVMNPEYEPNRLDGSCLFYFHSYPNRMDSTSNPYLKKKWFWDKEAYKNRKKK